MSMRNERILKYMSVHGSITTRDAMIELGIASPTKVISDLRKSGHTITDMWEKGQNRYGEICRYKRYFFKQEGRAA